MFPTTRMPAPTKDAERANSSLGSYTRSLPVEAQYPHSIGDIQRDAFNIADANCA
jgi:hypothetical protein